MKLYKLHLNRGWVKYFNSGHSGGYGRVFTSRGQDFKGEDSRFLQLAIL